jgi:membrane-anchored protein YejM (alkaline phosphatase superfamily)
LSSQKLGVCDATFNHRLGNIAAIDEMVADLIQQLDDHGILDNTYVVYTSDNGKPGTIRRWSLFTLANESLVQASISATIACSPESAVRMKRTLTYPFSFEGQMSRRAITRP